MLVFGLGLNSMQGREVKHTKLSCYSKNTTRGKKFRWWQVFKHELMDIIWLRLNEPNKVSYRRGCVVGDQAPRPVEKEKYTPSCCNEASNCWCGLPITSSEA